MAPCKVLVLHGFTHNGTLLRNHMSPIVDACGEDVEFVFADGPIILEPGKLIPLSSATLGDTQSRAWYRSNDDNTIYVGIDKAIAHLRDILHKEKFDGIIGFSQGATLSAVLCALLEKPNFHPAFLIDGKAPHPPMKFCIPLSGFKATDIEWTKVFENGYTTPTLHVIGTTDTIVPPAKSQTLVDVSKNNRIEYHYGAHIIPLNSNWCRFFAEFLKNPFGDIPSPGPSLAEREDDS